MPYDVSLPTGFTGISRNFLLIRRLIMRWRRGYSPDFFINLLRRSDRTHDWYYAITAFIIRYFALFIIRRMATDAAGRLYSIFGVIAYVVLR